MSPPPDPTGSSPAPSTRCAEVARRVGADPIGSTGTYEGFLLLHVPPPWPRDVNHLPVFRDEIDQAERHGWRVQAVDAPTTAVDGPVARFWRDAPGAYASDDEQRHVLVCTHGARDRCCGSEGTRLFQSIIDSWDLPARLWRTSHLGGHRFAPTALVLPEGTMWAHLDGPLLRAIVTRSVTPQRAASHYRGCTLLSDARVQVADRSAFVAVGWSWLDSARHGEVLADSGPFALVQIGNRSHSFVVHVESDGYVPVPPCGDVIDAATPAEPRYRVRRVERS